MKKFISISFIMLFSFIFSNQVFASGAEETLDDLIRCGDVFTPTEETAFFNKLEQEERMARSNLVVSNLYDNQLNTRGVTATVALAGWRTGTAIVKTMGYPNTAMYMKFAENKPAKTHTSNNNAWAKKVLFNDGILRHSYNTYKKWVMTNKKTLDTKGSHEFVSGDEYYALHLVSFKYHYVRQADGGVKLSGQVNDKYDFEWSKYNSIKAGFANNYAVAASKLGVIKPYPIVIKAHH